MKRIAADVAALSSPLHKSIATLSGRADVAASGRGFEPPDVLSIAIPRAGTSWNEEMTMSKFDAEDLEATGYFLPEDSQLRLKKLREYVGFLAHLARPRRADESQEWTDAIRPGEVAICLELLEAQIGQVLDELAWPAKRGEREAAREADAQADAAEPEAAGPVTDETGSRYVFGVTLRQIDEINLLLDMLRAHGDVVAANDDAEFAGHTLSTVGNAIFSGANKLREIILDLEAQRLDLTSGPRTGVREERATYHALPARLLLGSAWRVGRQLPTYQ
jgi:hypothetical protein